MRHFTASPTTDKQHTKILFLCITAFVLFSTLAVISLFVGKYPLTLSGILNGEDIQRQVFLQLRLSRTIMGICGGFLLGITGFVFQTVFRNALASPDIIGVSSGASVGAAFGILFFTGTFSVTLSAFAGALLTVMISLALSRLDRNSRNATIVLAGIAIQALAQMVLMFLKLTADPEKELASIEYWMMGSLSGISLTNIRSNLLIGVLCAAVLFLLHRQVLLLSTEESEARMLGVSVGEMRCLVLLISTIAVATVISLTGLISFIGLLAPHIARLLTRENRQSTLLLSGFVGGILLCSADILARSVASTELPVSIFTSLLGAPFLIYLLMGGKNNGKY